MEAKTGAYVIFQDIYGENHEALVNQSSGEYAQLIVFSEKTQNPINFYPRVPYHSPLIEYSWKEI